MKTLHTKIGMLGLLFMALLCFSSCDEDERIGMDVQGHWFGDMDMWIDDEKALGSEIEFSPKGWGYDSGTGVEVDYYRRGRVTHYFDYHIRNGVIYLTFDDWALDCAIVDYRLSYNYFSGYTADYKTLENMTYFTLRNYDRYWEQYGYGGYYDPYYVKGEADVASDSIWNDSIATRSANDEQPRCIRGVNRKKIGN